jgi:hypothetical protein
LHESQQVFDMNKRSRKIYFGFIAVLVLSENIGNFYSLIGPLKNTADLMGVSVDAERIRLVILVFLDTIPAIGAMLSVWGYRNSEAARAGRIGVVITTVGMLAYGGYQFWAATFQLGFMPTFHKLVGVVYATLGIIAWFVGSDLRKGLPSPNQSLQAN